MRKKALYCFSDLLILFLPSLRCPNLLRQKNPSSLQGPAMTQASKLALSFHHLSPPTHISQLLQRGALSSSSQPVLHPRTSGAQDIVNCTASPGEPSSEHLFSFKELCQYTKNSEPTPSVYRQAGLWAQRGASTDFSSAIQGEGAKYGSFQSRHLPAQVLHTAVLTNCLGLLIKLPPRPPMKQNLLKWGRGIILFYIQG